MSKKTNKPKKKHALKLDKEAFLGKATRETTRPKSRVTTTSRPLAGGIGLSLSFSSAVDFILSDKTGRLLEARRSDNDFFDEGADVRTLLIDPSGKEVLVNDLPPTVADFRAVDWEIHALPEPEENSHLGRFLSLLTDAGESFERTRLVYQTKDTFEERTAIQVTVRSRGPSSLSGFSACAVFTAEGTLVGFGVEDHARNCDED